MSTPTPIITTPSASFALLSVAANAERHNLASGEAWVLLLHISLPGEEDVYLARNLDPVTFDANDGNGPQVYAPFNFKMGEFTIANNGQLPQLEIQASNVGRILQGVLNQYSGAVGANVTLYVVNTANPLGEADLEIDFQVMSTTADNKLVRMKLGGSSPLRTVFPSHRFYPNHCIWQYKGAQCGYTGPLPSCDLTLDGPAGCEVHANSIRFGGFPGIDSAGASAAGVV